MGEVANSYSNVLAFGLADSYWNDFVGEVNALTTEQLGAAAERLVRPHELSWIVVGNLSKIEAPVRAAAPGDVAVLDADGNKIR